VRGRKNREMRINVGKGMAAVVMAGEGHTVTIEQLKRDVMPS
jgi:hypothetical protein